MESFQPLIGVPCRYDKSVNYPRSSAINAQNESYLSAISRAGGVPFLIPLNLETQALRALYDLSQGILLAGGGDIDPDLFGERPHPTLSDVQPERDRVEMILSRWAAEEEKPLLAICRGIQVLAVSGGGKLCQDLPSQMPEATFHRYRYLSEAGPSWFDLVHEVELTPSSRLAQILQTTSLRVNSLHHQAVTRVAEPLQATGHSSDGVVEVVEIPGHPFYCGVQWHPEVLIDDHESARRIFEVFVETCQKFQYQGEK